MSNTEKFYRSFGLDKSLPRSFLKKQELNQIFLLLETNLFRNYFNLGKEKSESKIGILIGISITE